MSLVPADITSLIREEYARQPDLLDGHDIDEYLVKLGGKAEILSDQIAGRCRAFVAYYCNDLSTKQAYITMVLVDPRDRGAGLGRALVHCVLTVARRRGFTTCRLEARKTNDVAYGMYRSQGFHIVEDRGNKYLLEVHL